MSSMQTFKSAIQAMFNLLLRCFTKGKVVKGELPEAEVVVTPPPTPPVDLAPPVMPTGLKRTDELKWLHPTIAKGVITALEECHKKCLMVHVFESYRTLERQDDLYAQGRTKAGKIVTRAKAGYSMHNYGLAIDLVFDGEERDGIQWSWTGDYNNEPLAGEKRSDYERVGEILEKHGFYWYARSSFPETPHFQMTFGLTLDQIRSLYAMRGLEGVWHEIRTRSLRD